MKSATELMSLALRPEVHDELQVLSGEEKKKKKKQQFALGS